MRFEGHDRAVIGHPALDRLVLACGLVAVLGGIAAVSVKVAQSRAVDGAVREYAGVAFAVCVGVVIGAVAVACAAYAVLLFRSLAWDATAFDEVGVVDATRAMSRQELSEAIAALAETERQLREQGRTEEARRVAGDRSMCLSALAERTGRHRPAG